MPLLRKKASKAAIRAAFRVPEGLNLPHTYAHHQGHQEANEKAWQTLLRNRKPEAKLLRECLSRVQQQEARRTGLIPVVGSKGGRWLVQINPLSFNLYKLVDDVARFRCLVFNGDEDMPPLDWAIGKVLLLEADEGTVDRRAN